MARTGPWPNPTFIKPIMSEAALAQSDQPADAAIPRAESVAHPAAMAVLVCAAYYVAAEIGIALTLHPHPVSTLWPPNATLLALLLLTPTRLWWMVVLAALPAHLFVELAAASRCPWSCAGSSATRPRP